MDRARIEAEVVEHRKIIKALHQYMGSQDISRREWGLIFAKAAGYEVFHLVRKRQADQTEAEVGAAILMMAIEAWASEDRLNVK